MRSFKGLQTTIRPETYPTTLHINGHTIEDSALISASTWPVISQNQAGVLISRYHVQYRQCPRMGALHDVCELRPYTW